MPEKGDVKNLFTVFAIYRPTGTGGFEGVRANPPKDFIYIHLLTVHFKCRTIRKWSTSLATIKNHCCPNKSGCSYSMWICSWWTSAERARKLFMECSYYGMFSLSQNGLRENLISKTFLEGVCPPPLSLTCLFIYTNQTSM